MNTNDNRPIWDVYDQYKTARFNVRYYERKLTNLRRWNFTIEIITALSVPTIAGLWIWSTEIGNIFWQIFTAFAAILAIIKPIIGLADKINENSEVLTKWRILDNEFQKLVIQISQRRIYDENMQKQFIRLLEIKTNIKEPNEEPNSKFSQKCFDKVNKELPSESFYIPEE